MNAYKKTLFISDLHLEASRPDITQYFLNLLNQCDATVDALYILGDLFEVWIGDDDDAPFVCSIIQALKTATQKGLNIFFLPGNRDFLIGKRFLRDTGCKLLFEEEKILLYGTPVLLMHGDTLCTHDRAYLKWRKISHHPLFHSLFFSLWPLSLRRCLANKIRQQSTQAIQRKTAISMDVSSLAVERIMQKHQVHYLIHGHTHKPQTHEFCMADTKVKVTRIVLGAWHECGNVFIWDESGRKEWIQF